MRGLRIATAVLLALGSLVLLGLGLLDMFRLTRAERGGASGHTEVGDRLDLAKSGMEVLFGSAILGLGAFLVALSAARIAARERREAEGARARVPGSREDVDEEIEEEPESAGEPEASTPVMTLEDLLGDLDHGDAQVRQEAARLIREMAPPARDAIGPLTEVLDRDEEDLRVLRSVARTIVALAGDPTPAVMGVARRLTHEDPRVRDWAVVTLGKIGPAAAGAVEALAGVLHDPVVGTTAAEALRRIGGEKAEAALRGERRA